MENVTKGIFKVSSIYDLISAQPVEEVSVQPEDPNDLPEWIAFVRGNNELQRKANAALIAEAFTVHDETGLSPKELVAENKLLRHQYDDACEQRNDAVSVEREEKAVLQERIKVLTEAATDIHNDITGGVKSCGHQYTCICAGDKLRATLSPSTEVNKNDE